MSFKDNPCRKFQANIFNKSKCQNCFKPRESHLLNDEDLNQAKPIYGGWLLLAPEGTNFDNPLHRSRKWQRRFFILYEHGLLRYALDEMPSTLPQGTINMNQCSDVIDGESRTGQKNSLCILTPEKEHFIRAECKEIINGWQEALTVYPRTNKQNQKKKRKVDPPTHQEPGPAKVTVTSSSSGGSIPCLPSSIASAERVPMSRATLWQEESRWSRATIPCSRSASCISQLSQSQPDSGITTQDDGGSVSTGRKVRVESGYFSLEKTKSEPSPQSAQHSQPPQPPQHLPLSSSASSSSLGAPSPRYSSESEPQTSPYQPSQDPFPSPGALVSPSYSTISSSQSSLDSEPSGTTPTWEGHSGGGGSRVGRSGREYATLSDVPRARRLSYREAFRSEKKRQELRARTRSPGREEVARLFGEERRRSQIIGRFEEGQHVESMDTSSSNEPSSNTSLRQGRSERRYLANKHEMSLDAGKDRSVPDVSSSTFSNLRRAKSLDRRVTESSMTPDLLNFKKGWMTKLYEDGMWKKHWFVLTDQSLRYYKDSIAEEASELDGEIDLSTCYDVKEYPVQRNYGFQILCKEGECTLSAMTSGIRRNWIQAIMKNVRPIIAPDVTRSLPEDKIKAQVMLEPCPQVNAEPSPSPSPEAPESDVRRQPAGNNTSAPPSEPRKSRVRERRREGRSKTFDWSEFKMEQTEKPVKERADTLDLSSSFSTTSSYCSPSSSSSPPSSLASSPVSTSSLQTSSVSGAHPPSMTEETQKENVRRGTSPRSTNSATHMPNTVTVTMTSTLNTTPPVQPLIHDCQEQGKMEVDHPTAIHPNSSDKKDTGISDVQEEIEQRWHQVETTPLREEKQVPISTAGNSDRLPAHELAALLDKELGQKQKELDRLQRQNNVLKEQLDSALGREQSAREGYVLQATCERGFAAMEETHHKVILDLQRQHQREISKLMEERERLLAEETAATIAAIEAMKNAHKEELEKNQRSQLSGLNSDIDELRLQYEEELQSIQRELEVLSEQYSQKCLENAHLAQALEAERQALRQCQRENQELNAHNQELNNRLTAEITRMRSCFSGETALSPVTQGKDVYELEVLLRIKESEIQYLKQEIHSLKDELQSALRDKKYATDKYKDIYTELSIVKAKADCDISKLKEKLLIATEALGERTVDGTVTSGYDIMKSKSNPDFMKKEKSTTSKQSRGLRSKSLKEGLTVQERMKLFESKDSKKI